MGLVPIRENLNGFGGFYEDNMGFGVGSSSANSLVLDERSGELQLVRVSLGRVGRNGGRATDAKAAMALKTHSEAERRRRERINGHLATLRGMVPGTSTTTHKLDKAALLAEVISRVKKLKSNAMETSKGVSIPSDADEASVEVHGDGTQPNAGSFSIKASLSCEDRAGLLADLGQTLQPLRLKTVQAEISTVGGRIRTVFVMTREGNPSDTERCLLTTNVQQALKTVIDRATLPEFVPRNSFASKRRRLSPFESSCLSSR